MTILWLGEIIVCPAVQPRDLIARLGKRREQYDEFLDFYGITEGDGMYLAPEDRILIW